MRRVVFNQKGGVGKSSITCNLAAIAASRGRRTLVVDLDVQGNASAYLGVDTHRYDMPRPEATVAHLLKQAAATWFTPSRPATEFVRATEYPHLDLLCSSPLLTQISNELESRYKIYKLRDALLELEPEYEQIFIDTPPNFNFYSKTALMASDSVLIPYDCDRFSRNALDHLLNNLVEIKQDHNPKLRVEGIVINQFNAQAKLPKTLIDELKADNLPVLGTYLTSSVKMKESHHVCKPLVYFAKKHRLTEQFEALYDELAVERLPESVV